MPHVPIFAGVGVGSLGEQKVAALPQSPCTTQKTHEFWGMQGFGQSPTRVIRSQGFGRTGKTGLDPQACFYPFLDVPSQKVRWQRMWQTCHILPKRLLLPAKSRCRKQFHPSGGAARGQLNQGCWGEDGWLSTWLVQKNIPSLYTHHHTSTGRGPK